MSRKDYVLIASAISDAALINCATVVELTMMQETRKSIALRLAEVFARDNPRFNKEKFLVACGVR